MNWDEIRYFTPDEFACRCGECDSDGAEMDLGFLWKLDQLRTRLKQPLIITSGYRCPAYNDRISTTGIAGPHTTGKASDIGISGKQAHRLLQLAVLGGWFSGIGIHQRGPHEERFIHLDTLTLPAHPRPRVWTY